MLALLMFKAAVKVAHVKNAVTQQSLDQIHQGSYLNSYLTMKSGVFQNA